MNKNIRDSHFSFSFSLFSSKKSQNGMGQNIREIDPKSFIFLNFQSILASNTQNIHRPKPAPDHRPPPKNTGPGPKIPAIIPPYKHGHRTPAPDPGLTYGHRPRIYTDLWPP